MSKKNMSSTPMRRYEVPVVMPLGGLMVDSGQFGNCADGSGNVASCNVGSSATSGGCVVGNAAGLNCNAGNSFVKGAQIAPTPGSFKY